MIIASSVVAFVFETASRWIVLAIISAIPVQITTTTEEQQRGELTEITATGVVLDRAGEATEVPFESLVTVQATSPAEGTPPAFRVTLVGGSELAAQSVSLADDQLTINLRRQTPLVVSARRVRSIRFHPASAATDAQWLGIVESEGSGDVMAIRRDGGRLDQVRGIVDSIADNVVNFSIDGSQVQAPIERLEGIVLASNETAASAASVSIVDIYGSRWMVDKIEPGKLVDPLRITLESDITHEIPPNQIDSIRWNSSLLLLTSEQPASKTYQPYLQTPSLGEAMNKWFGPASQGDDLVMHGDSVLEYRIEPGFERVLGSVVRDDSVNRSGKATVSIWLDDKQVWSEAIELNQARGFELPVAGAKRIQFKLETAGDGDFGDTVRINRPRLLK